MTNGNIAVPIRMIVIDDHKLMRHLLVDELSKADGISVLADFDSGEAAVASPLPDGVNLVIVDLSLPGMDGIETAQALAERGYNGPFLCLTMHLNPRLMDRAFDAGITGYVLKHDDFADLLFAVRRVVQGHRYISTTLLEVLRNRRAGSAGTSPLDQLTPREREVARLIAQGMTSGQIAQRLSISDRTVDAHRRNIAEKTGLRRVADITRLVLEAGAD